MTPKRLERELKRLKYELEVAQRQTPYLRGMIEGIHDRLVLIDKNGTIREYNSAFASSLQDDDVSLYGTSVATIYTTHPDDSEQSAPLLTEQILTTRQSGRYYGFYVKEAVELELSRVDIQGQELMVLSARPLDEDGKQQRELHAVRKQLDMLTERIQLEREQERAQRIEALALLAGTLAHDLNNALAVVCGNLDMLDLIISDAAIQDPDLRETMDDVRNGVASAQTLSQKLKTFTKGESVELRPLNMVPWLRSVVRLLEKAHQDQIRLTLPEEALWVSADEAHITQLLINLVSNAFQAEEEAANARTSVEISLRCATPAELSSMMFSAQNTINTLDEHLLLTVLDHGSGIDAAHLTKIFNPFFSTKQGGSGLGLASAAKIVFGHRGGISAENRREGGACLRVVLPRLYPTVARDDAPLDDELSLPSHHLHTMTVIVMDDEPYVRQTIKRILMHAQAHVLEASCCEEVLALHHRLVVEQGMSPEQLLFILDLNIEGGRSGIETLSLLQHRDPSSRAIACSGYFPMDNARYTQLGFKAFLAKPFTAEELLEAARQVTAQPISVGDVCP